jgi:carboxyvinyl-carboxyphosphonate phosphorylmutase
MTANQRRKAFRAVLAGPACLHPASVFDAVSGRIAAELGYETAILGGSVASLAVLGAPDHIVLTLTEFADLIRRITRGGAPPLLVDADHGYGNALSAMRTVEELEEAGVAALTLEDTLLPRPYGPDRPALLPLEEGLGKLRAALAARTDPDLVIAARTSALSVTGPEDAVARARAYAEAGADAIFVTGVTALTSFGRCMPRPACRSWSATPRRGWATRRPSPNAAPASRCRAMPPIPRRCRRCTTR